MIRTLTVAGLAALALAACSPPAEPAPPAQPAPPVEPAPAPTPAPVGVLTAEGFAPLRIGMTVAEIGAALGPDSNPDAVGGPDPESCDQFHPARAPEGLLVMVENGRLTSVWLTGGSTVATDRGLKIGDTAARVREVYGAAAVVEPHKYQGAPAEYVTVWATPNHDGADARGIKYEIGGDGRVQSIAAGGPSTQYVEGCA